MRTADPLRVTRAAMLTLLAVAPAAGGAQSATPRLCEPGGAGTPIVGTVVDMLSRRPLPGATVTLRRPAEWVPEVVAVAEADADGRFVFCAVGAQPRWDVLARIDTVESRARSIGEGGRVDTLYVPWSRPVNLGGYVRVLGTQEPVAGARIEVLDRPVRAISGDDGAFRLRGIGGGPLVVRTSSVGLQTRVDTIMAESGSNVRLEILMSADPIELPPIVVTAAAPRPDLRVRTPTDLGMTPEQVDAILPRSIDFVTMLRWSNTPGLLVQEGREGVCVAFLRASGGCSMVEVFVNGVRMPNGAEYLAALDPSAVKEFIILRPAFAQFQYMGPRTQNGVLDIILR